MYYILFIHSSVDGRLDCFHVLVIMNNVSIGIYVQVSGYMFLYLLGIYLGMALMSHKVTLYLTLSESAFFQSSSTILHSLKKCMWLTICPHTFQHLLLLLFIKAILVCEMVSHHGFDFYFSLMINDAEHLFICSMAIRILSLDKCSCSGISLMVQ